jgi:hypothetical protein
MQKILASLLLLLCLNSYGQKGKEPNVDSMLNIMTSKEELPAEFAGSNTILIVYRDAANSVNKYLEKALENEYHGEYRLIDQGEHLNRKDTAKARYFVMIMPKFTPGHWAPSGDRQGPETEYQMVMTDRTTKTMYYFKKTSSCFSCLFKDYFKKLEQLRGKGN